MCVIQRKSKSNMPVNSVPVYYNLLVVLWINIPLYWNSINPTAGVCIQEEGKHGHLALCVKGSNTNCFTLPGSENLHRISPGRDTGNENGKMENASSYFSQKDKKSWFTLKYSGLNDCFQGHNIQPVFKEQFTELSDYRLNKLYPFSGVQYLTYLNMEC